MEKSEKNAKLRRVRNIAKLRRVRKYAKLRRVVNMQIREE
jgi:hypothetical protein